MKLGMKLIAGFVAVVPLCGLAIGYLSESLRGEVP